MPESRTAPHIGVLAIQGDFEAHAAALQQAGATTRFIRDAEGLADLDGLVIPGGESTTMLKFLDRGGLFDALREFVQSKPVFGTCAGTILLAREVRNPAQRSLGVINIVVERNAYGDQRDSAILTLATKLPTSTDSVPVECVFIRAPRIVETGAGVEVLSRRDGSPALVREGNRMAATFHPELSADRSIHQFFVELVQHARSARS